MKKDDWEIIKYLHKLKKILKITVCYYEIIISRE